MSGGGGGAVGVMVVVLLDLIPTARFGSANVEHVAANATFPQADTPLAEQRLDDFNGYRPPERLRGMLEHEFTNHRAVSLTALGGHVIADFATRNSGAVWCDICRGLRTCTCGRLRVGAVAGGRYAGEHEARRAWTRGAVQGSGWGGFHGAPRP